MTNPGWLHGFPHFRRPSPATATATRCAGGIRLADARRRGQPDLRPGDPDTDEDGFGLDDVLRGCGRTALVGILNGIDTTVWDPADRPHLAEPYSSADIGGQGRGRAALSATSWACPTATGRC